MSESAPLKKCPHCGYLFEAHTFLEDEKMLPTAGQLSVCFECGEFGMFEENGCVRKMEDPEFIGLPLDVQGELMRVSRAIKYVRSMKKIRDCFVAKEIKL